MPNTVELINQPVTVTRRGSQFTREGILRIIEPQGYVLELSPNVIMGFRADCWEIAPAPSTLNEGTPT